MTKNQPPPPLCWAGGAIVGFISVAVRAAALLPQLRVGALSLFQRLFGGLQATPSADENITRITADPDSADVRLSRTSTSGRCRREQRLYRVTTWREGMDCRGHELIWQRSQSGRMQTGSRKRKFVTCAARRPMPAWRFAIKPFPWLWSG